MKPPQLSPHFPDCFYRVTAKALYIKDGKVMLVQDLTGRSDTDDSPEWELPGGGLDFGEQFQDTLKREVKEEMNLEIAAIEDKPTYVWTVKRENSRGMEWWYVCTVVFRVDFVNLNFMPTKECAQIKFFSKEELKANYADLAAQVKPLAEAFHPEEFK